MVLIYSIFKGLREFSYRENFIKNFSLTKNSQLKNDSEILNDLASAKTFAECMKAYTEAKSPGDAEYLALEMALEKATTKEECWLVGHHSSSYNDLVKKASEKSSQVK